jgi:hypothetical protein
LLLLSSHEMLLRVVLHAFAASVMCSISPSYRTQQRKQTPWPESARELYRPIDRRLSPKLLPTFADRGCCMVSTTHPYGRILGFPGWSPYYFSQVTPQLYSRGSVDPVPDPLLLRKSGSAGNRTWTSGSVARNSDHYTTEAVYFLVRNIYKFSSYLTGNTIHLRSVARISDH